jgi:hypothetical protein
MRPECIAEMAKAIGQPVDAVKAAGLEQDILQTLRRLASSDPKWSQLSGDQRLQLAAETAKADAIDAADKQAQRRAGSAVAQVREATHLTERGKALGGKQGFHDALFERMRTVDDFTRGVTARAMQTLTEAIDAIEPGFMGLFEKPANERAFAQAVLGEGKPEPHMARAAKAYTQSLEDLRVRANAAGDNIGKLDGGYLPRTWDVGKVARTDPAEFAAKMLPRLDPAKYVRADGAPMDDAELTALLLASHETLATEGRNKRTPGQSGQGSRASRFDDAHREIHFKDADSYLQAMSDYGRGTMLEAIHGHLGTMAKNISMLEELGANPNSTYRLLKDMAEKGDNATGLRSHGAGLDMVWDTLNGTTAQPVSAKLAAFFQGARNLAAATKLGSVLLSSVNDIPLTVLVAKSSGVPMGKAMGAVFAGVGKDRRAIAHGLGIGLDEVAGEMARWHSDNLAQGWTRKAANLTMKLSLVNAQSYALRRGFGLTLSETLHRMTGTDWEALGKGDRMRLESGGVTAKDWGIWQLAKPYELDGAKLLHADGIHAIADADLARVGASATDRTHALTRLLGYLDAEGHDAVMSPNIMTRAAIQQGTRAGTVGGEILRTVMLFKSFSMGIVLQHLRRIRNIPTTAGKIAYSAALLSTSALTGAVSLQLKDIVFGKDPRDMTTGKFWLAAMAQGGGLGVYGDMLYTGMGGNSRGGQANWTNFAGPVFGTAFDAVDVARKGLGWVTADEGGKYKAQQQFGGDALRFVKGNLPVVNLWYTRAAIDHLLMHDLQERVSPGYLQRMRERSRHDWKQGYWWRPGDTLPDRVPDFGSMDGGSTQ